jgi:hypothetical protein
MNSIVDLHVGMGFILIDAGQAKRTQFMVLFGEISGCAWIDWVAATAMLVVVHNPAAAIEFKMTTSQEQVAQLFAGALHARFSPR